MKGYQKDFPIFKKEFKKNQIIYLDSAATAQKPKKVIDRVTKFYEHETSNLGRGNHLLSEKNEISYEDVRRKTAEFIKANSNEIVFTSNCTDSINLIANSIGLNKEDEVIVSEIEHHSNFLPWQQKATLKICEIDENGYIDISCLESLISKKTKLIAITYASNITGIIQPVEKFIKIAKGHNIPILVDAAQVVSHFPINVSSLGCDFLTFSAHKMFGPSGVGILYVKKDSQKMIYPYKFGGGMVNKVSENDAEILPFPHSFESGTPNIEGVLGFGEAIDYIIDIGFENIAIYLNYLEKYMSSELKKLDFINVFYPSKENHLPIFTIIPKNIDVDIKFLSQLLSDSFKIIVRGGHHCCQYIYNKKNLKGGIRVSLHIYNTKKDIDKFISALNNLRQFF